MRTGGLSDGNALSGITFGGCSDTVVVTEVGVTGFRGRVGACSFLSL